MDTTGLFATTVAYKGKNIAHWKWNNGTGGNCTWEPFKGKQIGEDSWITNLFLLSRCLAFGQAFLADTMGVSRRLVLAGQAR